VCLGLPARVIEMADEQRGLARVDMAGVTRVVNLGLLADAERPAPGDYVLVHAGMALGRIDSQEALELQRLLAENAEASMPLPTGGQSR
jgi:hydrogenase expression/formation protein HypC